MNDTTRAPVLDTSELTRQLRPAWTPVNIALMVVFFVTGSLWFLGLAMIFYMAYGKEIGLDLSNWGNAKRSGSRIMSSMGGSTAKTGNAAFDDWREQELERLAAERRKLDEARAEFDEYVRELRRARDAEEFDAWRNRQTVDGAANSDRAEG